MVEDRHPEVFDLMLVRLLDISDQPQTVFCDASCVSINVLPEAA